MLSLSKEKENNTSSNQNIFPIHVSRRSNNTSLQLTLRSIENLIFSFKQPTKHQDKMNFSEISFHQKMTFKYINSYPTFPKRFYQSVEKIYRVCPHDFLEYYNSSQIHWYHHEVLLIVDRTLPLSNS